MLRNSPRSTWLFLLLAGGGLLVAAAMVPAQLPKQPSTPPRYRVILRYDIPAPRDQHVEQYDAMIEHLAKLGFEFDPPLAKRPETDREDRSKNRMEGFIASAKVLRILDNRSVASIMFYPDDMKLDGVPPDQPVWVRLELASGLSVDRQRELFEQVRALLSLQQFREAVGYDNRGYSGKPFSRLVGTVPAARLDTLLKDQRGQPGGWLAPVIPPGDLPTPLRNMNPFRIIELLRENEPIKVFAEPEPRAPDYLEKISPDLWELVKQAEVPPGRIRVQVVFVGTITERDTSWRVALAEAVPEFFVEGQLGQFVTGLVPAAQIKALAAMPGVSVIRLPRLTRVDADPALKLPGDNARALSQSGVAAFHKRGAKGKGVRLGIIDVDFRGWQTLVKAGKLPKRTRLVDLTSERDPGLVPAPYSGEPQQPGHGTLCAQAAALAAPEAEIVLIRTDAIDPYQLREILRYVQGGNYSPTIEVRRDELFVARAKLHRLRDELAKERQRVLNNFDDETDLRERVGFLGAAFGWLYSERTWHRARMQHYEKLDESLADRDARLERFLQTVDSLRGIPILACPLVWSDGFPLGSLSPLSRSFENSTAGQPLWFQSAGNKRGQCWIGDFHSLAGQAAMDFAGPDAVVKGRWTAEMNFLAWQPHRAARQPDLPEKAQIRLTVQWREPHDPDYYQKVGNEDYYRKPLATLKLVLLRQRDPDAKTVPADLFEVVTQSTARPQRLEHQPAGTVYEIAVEVNIDKAGRYALRVERQPDSQWIVGLDPKRKQPALAKLEGLNPVGTRPLGVPVLPALAQEWELRPRIFVETMDETVRLQGRAVFADYFTDAGTVGMPADSRGVISVGAADLDGKPRPETAVGPMPFVELSQRPTLLAYDTLQLDGGTAFGSSVATAFAAGAAAAVLSSGTPGEHLRAWLHTQEGKVLRLQPPAGK
jgi:hypothetical protein